MFFTIFGTYIPYYGFFVALGFICALFSGFLLCKFLKLDFYDFLIISSVTLASGFIGAKILYIFININRIDFKIIFSDSKAFSTFINSGFVFYGGLIGGIASLIILYKFFRIDICSYEKVLAPSICVAHAFGRIGCSFAGCCYGRPTDGFLYFIYDSDTLAPAGIKLVPVQGIESFFLFVLFFTLLFFILRKTNIKITAFYLLSYSVFRFIIEFYRYDYLRGKIFFLSTSQFISVVIFISVSFHTILKRRHQF